MKLNRTQPPTFYSKSRFVFMVLLLTIGCKPNSQNISFTKHTLTTDFISEGVAIGDVNSDGLTDIMAGSFWFEAPDWRRHEIDTPSVFPIIEGRVGNIEDRYSNSMLNFSMDVNLDGLIDFIRIDFPGTEAYWYQNPGNNIGHWKRSTIFETVGNESPRLVDIDGDGRKDLLCGDADTHQMIYLKAPNDGSGTWKKEIITTDSVPGTKQFAHGLGFADLNGDQERDVIITDGWWEYQSNEQPNWYFHPTNISQPCAQIEAIDVDGDGDKDLITSSAHKRGIWWQEQINPTSWKEHFITGVVSQTHALSVADINSDGQPDIITGKRYYASSGNGEGALEPSSIIWLEFTPGEVVEWKVHQVDDNSGVGLNIVTDDVNGDDLTDIVTANKKGVFYFQQNRQ